jgi:hypothetical protein
MKKSNSNFGILRGNIVRKDAADFADANTIQESEAIESS